MLADPTDPMPVEGDPAAGPSPGEEIPNREKEALTYREGEATRAAKRDPLPLRNRNNGEENTLVVGRRRIFAANSTKGMPHDPELGEVVPRTGDLVTAYERLLAAVNSENPADFNAIPIGPNERLSTPTDPPPPTRPFVDPQASLSLDLEGPDAPAAATYRGALNSDGTLKHERILDAPRFETPWLAADVGEVYLMALLRDVHVTALQGATSSDSRVQDAVALTNEFSDYRGPASASGEVTPQELFRGGNVLSRPPGQGRNQNVGELIGPYVSQYLLIGSRIDSEFPPTLTGGGAETRQAGLAAQGVTLRRDQGEVVYGTLTINQQQFEVEPKLDFVTTYDTWLQVLQGVFPEDLPLKVDRSSQYTGERRFLYSLRQMAEYVHRDQTYQEGLIAALLIISMNERAERLAAQDPNAEPLFNPGNAYLGIPNQTGFGTFGNGHVLALLAEATTRAIKAAWAQKWLNQRRLRPEVLGGRIHNTVIGRAARERYDINKEISSLETSPGSKILDLIERHNAEQNEKLGRDQKGPSYLLPQQYPEGSPTHPAYPAGHATQIAAEVTVLKGLFNENFPITDALDPALVPNEYGTALELFTPLDQPQIELTLGGELNKLAANVALARSLAGVHYRLDYSESMLLGEYVGLGILQEQALSYNQARNSGPSRRPPFFFELTLFSGLKVRVTSTGAIIPAPTD